MAAFARPVLRRDVPKNKVALAAIRQVEELAKQVAVPADDITTARTLAQFFTDIHDIEVLLGRRERWVSEARAPEIEAPTAFDRDLLALAAVVLSHESFERNDLDRSQLADLAVVVELFEDRVGGQISDQRDRVSCGS